MNASANNADAPVWQVICLCAAWCGACRDWRPAFDTVAAAHPQLRFAWVDIEDDADALGDLEIETFPTVLVAHGGLVRFFGPVQPHAAQLDRLLASLREAGAGPGGAPSDPQAQDLLHRLVATALPRA